MPPRILLADCDAMFAAVARLVDPEGAGRAPLLVVGGTRGSRGVVCSASYEARAFGIRSGMPIGQAEHLCPKAMFVPVPRHECAVKSREVKAVLDEWAPVVEPASIDEFYLGMDGTEALYRHEPLAVTAARIRQDVLARTGLTLSFGGGTNRLIAKLAVEAAKPRAGRAEDGVLIVPPGTEAEFVATLPLAALPGVGPRFQATLRAKGLTAVKEVLPLERRVLAEWFGPRTGQWLYERVRGRASARVSGRDEAKSVSHETTFDTDLTGDAEMTTILVRLVTAVSRDLRRAGLSARTVTIKLRDHDFRTRNASRTLAAPVASDRAVLPVAIDLFQSLRGARRVPARLLGIGLSQLSPRAAHRQLALFADPSQIESDRDVAVADTMDRIRQRFGPEAIRPARLVGPDQKT